MSYKFTAVQAGGGCLRAEGDVDRCCTHLIDGAQLMPPPRLKRWVWVIFIHSTHTRILT